MEDKYEASESSSSPPEENVATLVQLPQTQAVGPKRSAADAGLKPNGRPGKSVKRRASKACQCCRSRKVRCNVIEHGPPCTNCRLDEVECIVSESKRKKKWTGNGSSTSPPKSDGQTYKSSNGTLFPAAAQPPYEPVKKTGDHVPHTLYQDLGKDMADAQRRASLFNPNMLMNMRQMSQRGSVIPETAPILNNAMSPMSTAPVLPAFIRPLPTKFGADDMSYLERKGALTVPAQPLRDQLLGCYAEFVHPFMPLLNLHDIVAIIDSNGADNQISLLLFQAIMFAGIATVDVKYLKAVGYNGRRDARRDFFQKARLLYDFDYEIDRIPLIQSLLLMTYWYETPDDQKDSHHWMGIAVSLSHTIGLHRDPTKSSMDPARQSLWKRIWWSTYMRDRLIALGMRRPTKIKNKDFDVPMLTEDDFETTVLPDGPSCIPASCTIMRDAEKQRQSAVMCVEKAKLCICVSDVLSVQYSVLHNNHGVLNEEGSTRTTMMLVAKKLEPEIDEVQMCNDQLQKWKEELAPEAQYVTPTATDVKAGNGDLILNRSLLHMVYYATLSALHRPQVLPSSGGVPRSTKTDILEISRKAVRLAAGEITSLANTLYNLNLVRFLPTTGITVLLPAIIIHLLDIKAPEESTRRVSLQGFCQCMQIMSQLRDIYAAADYSTAFLEAAIRKAEITLPQKPELKGQPRNFITSTQGLVEAGRRMDLIPPAARMPDPAALTPPPDSDHAHFSIPHQTPDDPDTHLARHLQGYLASTPPDSDDSNPGIHPHLTHNSHNYNGDASGGLHTTHQHQHDPNIHPYLQTHQDPQHQLTYPPTLFPSTSEPNNDNSHHSNPNNQFPHFNPSDPTADFDSLINLEAAGEMFSLEGDAFAAMQGESSGFTMETDWMVGMKDEGGGLGFGFGASGRGVSEQGIGSPGRGFVGVEEGVE
ncbi:hypothetical protein MBLNU230_g1060t1 [Neophaeotheca triangularis]